MKLEACETERRLNPKKGGSVLGYVTPLLGVIALLLAVFSYLESRKTERLTCILVEPFVLDLHPDQIRGSARDKLL